MLLDTLIIFTSIWCWHKCRRNATFFLKCKYVIKEYIQFTKNVSRMYPGCETFYCIHLMIIVENNKSEDINLQIKKHIIDLSIFSAIILITPNKYISPLYFFRKNSSIVTFTFDDRNFHFFSQVPTCLRFCAWTLILL